jgi:hypothetical protein
LATGAIGTLMQKTISRKKHWKNYVKAAGINKMILLPFLVKSWKTALG